MPKQIIFDGDSLRVVQPGPVNEFGMVTGASWEIQPEQVARHRAMFDADMSAAQRNKADAVAAKFSPAGVSDKK